MIMPWITETTYNSNQLDKSVLFWIKTKKNNNLLKNLVVVRFIIDKDQMLESVSVVFKHSPVDQSHNFIFLSPEPLTNVCPSFKKTNGQWM